MGAYALGILPRRVGSRCIYIIAFALLHLHDDGEFLCYGPVVSQYGEFLCYDLVVSQYGEFLCYGHVVSEDGEFVYRVLR
jgi:hypothetical protein